MLLSREILLLTTALLPSALADWQYLSRPDLSPPRLNITIPATAAVDEGYLFVAPYSGFDQGSVGPDQPGAYIFRDNGDLVWSGYGYLAGWIADFAPTVVDGQSAIAAFQGILDARHGRMYGNHAVLNRHYETVQVVGTASHRLASCHEFRVVDGKSVLIETPVAQPADLTAYGAEEDQRWIVSNGFQEIDIQTGELIFEWYSTDHVTPRYSKLPLEGDGSFSARTSADAWNYFHINSVDKDDENNYLISARNYATIFKINGTDGEIIWRLGGTHGSDFEIPRDVEFAYQHDARFRYRSPDGSIERISFFDNAAHSAGRRINPFSRARYVELNHTAGTARAINTFRPPDDLVAYSQGNAQHLPNGNVFVNWGQAGAVTEYNEEGKVIFHAYLDAYPSKNVQNYRGFRFPWIGIPKEEPAVLALGDRSGQISVYVSWNGDTETAFWYFYLVDGRSGAKLDYLGKQRRLSFETTFEATLSQTMTANLADVHIIVEAHDINGHIGGRSRLTKLTDKAPYSHSSASTSHGSDKFWSELQQQRFDL
ncbi:ASST-domain-containing protein [Talaromyces proteolyticus]|uniref:ASST-domain-containing protein n=1 Tax=Talaromyces proteolyticus TaxID=1131652 RepID=A0AAD4KKL7_9EURO|nr:ASST-domain-containing protein [Talaromyces proteolyticus]KAH8693544.1 ASST-domain-containing protein [Talaromyces proteolyticus]